MLTAGTAPLRLRPAEPIEACDPVARAPLRVCHGDDPECVLDDRVDESVFGEPLQLNLAHPGLIGQLRMSVLPRSEWVFQHPLDDTAQFTSKLTSQAGYALLIPLMSNLKIANGSRVPSEP